MSKKSSKKNTKSAKKKPAQRRKTAGVPFWRQPVFWGLLMALFAFAVMVMFGRLPSPQVEQQALPQHDETTLTDLQVEVESLLWRLGVQAGEVSQKPSEGVIDLRLQVDFPDAQQITLFAARLQELSTDLRLESYPPRKELRVFSGPALMVRLRFLVAAQEPVDAGPAVTIIMDDMGRSLSKVRRLLAIEQPVTLAILPSTPHALEAANLAHAQGREIMVHIPMEPQGYPAIEPGRDALLLEHSEWEVERRLTDMFQRVPYAVGGNNHMGSRYTEYAVGMQVVGKFMHDRGLLFVDSRTTGKTLAEKTMQEMGVPVIARDVFLDNNQDVESIRHEIRRLSAQAKRHGRAVGICHPYPETLTALEAELPSLSAEGVRMVPVAEMIRLTQERGN